MKKITGALALLKGLKGAKKQVGKDTTLSEDVNDVIDLLKAIYKGEYKIKKRNILAIIVGVIYVLNPFDLLPALALGPIGLIDDAAVLVFIYKRIASELDRYRSTSKYQDAEIV